MARENKVLLSSFRVRADLAAFLKQRAESHPKGFTGIAEECLEAGAVLKGYKPPNDSDLEGFLHDLEIRLTERVAKRLESAKGRRTE